MKRALCLFAACGMLSGFAACSDGQLPIPGQERDVEEPDGEDEPSGGSAAPDVPVDTIEYEGLNGRARNPIISHVFTADPSAKVFEGRIYIYASHDLDDQMGYEMRDYHVFSSNDLVNWQDHGVALNADDMPWVSFLYAPDAAYSEATGKYYLYFPNAGSNIGVAVSESPAGPFVDALGGPLVSRLTPGALDVDWVFDPSVFVDDDGQAYLYFGGGPQGTGDNARVIRLGEDMVSLADDAAVVEAPDFFEAAFAHKHGDRYFFSYSTTFAKGTATIDYLVSDNPMMGFEFVGTALPNPIGNNNGNNHHSIVEYEGNSYIFYQNRVLSTRDRYSSFQRSITLDRLTYDTDGSIVPVSASMGEVTQLRNLDAFARLEAETIADQRGIEVDFVVQEGSPVGVTVTDIHDRDWIGYSQVDFGEGATTFLARVAADSSDGGVMDIYVDGCDLFADLPGERIGSCTVDPTGGWQAWRLVECDVEVTEGVHDLYLRFSGVNAEPLFNFDYFQFE